MMMIAVSCNDSLSTLTITTLDIGMKSFCIYLEYEISLIVAILQLLMNIQIFILMLLFKLPKDSCWWTRYNRNSFRNDIIKIIRIVEIYYSWILKKFFFKIIHALSSNSSSWKLFAKKFYLFVNADFVEFVRFNYHWI